MNGTNDENRNWDQVSGAEVPPVDAGTARPVAFCQNCGKGLTTETRRVVGPAVYCEPCLAAKLGGAAGGPAAAGQGYAGQGWGPVTGNGVPAGAAGAFQPPVPNPGLAALLGLIPGVGAMYNEQYAKGIAHLVIFAGLVLLAHVSDVFILFIFGWVAYMAIEAHHTARARLDGTPLPNPFGLNDIGERMGFGKAWPAGPSVATVARDAADAAAAEYRSMSGGFGSGYRTAAGTGPVSGQGTGPGVPPTPAQAAAATDAGADAAAGAGWGAPVEQFGGGYSQPGYAPPPQQQTAYGAQQAGYGAGYGTGYGAGYGSVYGAGYGGYVPPMPPMPPMPPIPPASSRFPAGAIWLIGLGTIFLLGTTGIFRGFSGLAVLGLVLIGTGVWTFVRKMTETGLGLGDDGTPLYRARLLRAIRGASWTVLVGVLLLLNGFGWVRWENSWPWLIIAAGVLMLLNRALYRPEMSGAYYPAAAPVVPAAQTSAVAVTGTGDGVARNEAEFRQGGN